MATTCQSFNHTGLEKFIPENETLILLFLLGTDPDTVGRSGE